MTNKQATKLPPALAAVKRAALRREGADDQYRQAITNAHQAGYGLTEIGRAAGKSKQGIYHLTRPDPRKKET